MIAIDTNVLVYAQVRQGDAEGDAGRHLIALQLVYDLTSIGAIIPVQVLGEFTNVCIRKLGMAPQAVMDQIADYLWTFETPVTTVDHIIAATSMASRHKLQFFDALIIAVARSAGATILLSEDMQDGLQVAGLTVRNPFNPANAGEIADLLAG